MSLISSPVLAGSRLDLKPQVFTQELFVKSNLIVKRCLESIGRTCQFIQTSQNSMGSNSPEQLMLFAGGIPANRLAQQDSAAAQKIKDISGRKCCELYKVAGLDGSLPKMFMDTLASVLTKLPHRWSLTASPSGRLIFTLAPLDYQRWNGTSGLLPRPMASDSKGAGKRRYRTSPKCRGNFREVIRETSSDGIYPRPEFVEWVKGFPEGWTDSSLSETPSPQLCHSSSARPS